MENIIIFLTENQTLASMLTVIIGVILLGAVWNILKGVAKIILTILVIAFMMVSLGLVTSEQVQDFFLNISEKIKAIDFASIWLNIKNTFANISEGFASVKS